MALSLGLPNFNIKANSSDVEDQKATVGHDSHILDGA